MALFADSYIVGQGCRQVSATPIMSIGTRVRTAHGRVYRYVKGVASTTLYPGVLVTGPPPRADLAPPAAGLLPTTALRAGDTVLSLTLPAGAAAVAPNEYASGLLCCIAGVFGGPGRDYVIDSHTGGVGGGVIQVRLPADDALDIDQALTDNAMFTMHYNPFSNVQLLNNAASGPVLGVTVSALNAVSGVWYGWVQSAGMSGVKIAGAIAVGALVYPSGSVGSGSATATQIAGMPPIGTALAACAVSSIVPVMLTIE
jgi:hypothetical protein